MAQLYTKLEGVSKTQLYKLSQSQNSVEEQDSVKESRKFHFARSFNKVAKVIILTKKAVLVEIIYDLCNLDDRTKTHKDKIMIWIPREFISYGGEVVKLKFYTKKGASENIEQ